MLTGNLVRLRFARDKILPQFVDESHPELLDWAGRLLLLVRDNVGQPHGKLDDEMEELFSGESEPLLFRGLAKILEDRCEFEVASAKAPDEVRETVFRLATQQRRREPLFDRAAVLEQASLELGLSADDLERGLFADLKTEQRLTTFDDLTPQRLLQRYNVGLAQAILLRSVRVEIVIEKESPQRFRQLFRAIKFHRLLFDVQQTGPEAYKFVLDGPLSLFSATQRYGLQLAVFLPSVLLCKNFKLHAEVRWGPKRQPKTLDLSHEDNLTSHLLDVGMHVPQEVTLFVELFRKKIADWELHEITELVPLPGRPWIPDFKLVHRRTGKSAYLEILGFWRRASVEKHLAHLREHLQGEPCILAVSQQLHTGDEALENFPAGVVSFKNMPIPDDVVRMAALVCGIER